MCEWQFVGDISTPLTSRTLLHTTTTLKRRNVRFLGKGERPYLASLAIVIKCEFLSRGKPVPSKGLVVVEGSAIYHFFPIHAPSISGRALSYVIIHRDSFSSRKSSLFLSPDNAS